MKGAAAVLIAALAITGGGIAYAGLTGAAWPFAQGAGGKSSGLRVQGHVVGLYPGASEPLRLRVTNHYPFPIRIGRIHTVVGPAGKGCPAANLWVGERSRPRRKVAARRSNQVHLRVKMAANAPDACQGARWPLGFQVEAEGQKGHG